MNGKEVVSLVEYLLCARHCSFIFVILTMPEAEYYYLHFIVSSLFVFIEA